MKFTFAPEASPLPGYTIKRAINRGGFGEVYYALSDSGKEVALKLLQRNQQIELRGVRQCLNLKHPNLVTIFDIRTDHDEDHWVVMEYVSGKSLELVLDEHPRGLPIPEVEAWLTGMAAGIGFLHDRGIVHRDLKPANVFRENGVVKIGDVGLSKFITPSRRSAQTESVGTVYYMAPEVARGKYGSELDVYSLGIMLYEMLTGHVPFNGESTGEILMKHLTEAPDLSKVPAQFRTVLSRALEKDPQRRTPGAVQLAEEFRNAVQGKPPVASAPATHFVDVERVEKIAGAGAQPAVNGQASGHAHTLPYAQGGAPPPPPPRGSPAVAKTAWQRLGDELQGNPWLAVSLVIVLLTIFPIFGGLRFLRGPTGMVIPAAFAYAIYWFVKNHRRVLHGLPAETRDAVQRLYPRHSPPAHGSPVVAAPPPPPPPTIEPAPVRVAVAAPQRPTVPPGPLPPPRPVARVYSPITPRPISLRQRLSQLSSSMALAVLYSAAATGIVGFLGSLIPAGAISNLVPALGGPAHSLADPARVGLFGLTTLLGAWAVIVPTKLWEGIGTENTSRRIVSTALGAAVGACAFWLHQSLFVETTFESAFPGIFDRVGSFPLLTSSRQPTLAGYVAMFATLFGLRRWWWLADSFRPKRFRIVSIVWTSMIAAMIPALFVFPQAWAVCWGGAITLVVQLATPWVEPKSRQALVEARAAA
jgi:eukaryotic-like serine/threonine-protein kinase